MIFHYLSGETNQLPVMRQVPWFVDSSKRIAALCFDPSGSWLLVAGELMVLLLYRTATISYPLLAT